MGRVAWVHPGDGSCWGSFLARGGVTVYLQQRLWGTTDFTDIAQVTTQAGTGLLNPGGHFTYTVPSPTPWAAYRAICQGAAHAKTWLPAMVVWRPTPKLTLKLINVVNGVVPALGTPTFKGSARPLKLAGEKVNLPVYKWRAVAKRWVKVRTGTAVISAKGPTHGTSGGRKGSGPVRTGCVPLSPGRPITLSSGRPGTTSRTSRQTASRRPR